MTTAAIAAASHARRGSAGSNIRIQCSPPKTARREEHQRPDRARAAARDHRRPRARPARGRPGCSRGASDRGPHGIHQAAHAAPPTAAIDRRAAGPPGDEALAAGDLQHGSSPGDLARDDEQAAARRAPEPARRAGRRRARRRRPRARGGSARRRARARPWSSTSASRTCAVGPGEQVRVDDHRAPVAGQQQAAAAALGEVDGERRGGAHGGVERLLGRPARAGRARSAAASRPPRSACAPSSPRRARRSASGCATPASPRGAPAGRRSPSRPARSARRGRARQIPSPPPEVARTREHAREHEHLVGVVAADHPLRRARTGRAGRARAGRARGGRARPKVTSTRTRARPRPVLRRTGSASSGSSIQPGGSGSRPRRASTRSGSGWSSSTLRPPELADDASRPRRRARSTRRSRRRAGSAPRR